MERKGGTAPLDPVKGKPGIYVYNGDRPSTSASTHLWREVAQRALEKTDDKPQDEPAPKTEKKPDK